MSTNKMTALYCRISREDELSDISSSIETQKAYLSRYANQNKHHNIRYYIDDGYSGANFERPGFEELKKDIDYDLIDTVITKDLSRLGRDYLMTGYYMEHYFPMHNVRYIAINDQVDTNNGDNDFAPFRNIMNEWYARDISKKIRSAYKTKALNGEFTGAYPSYGYNRDGKDKHKLAINTRQAEIVKMIYKLYLEGVSLYKISNILKANKVLTPRADLNVSDGVYISENVEKYPYDWASQSILGILKNEVYTGTIVCNRHQTSSFKSKKLKQNPKSEWIVSTNKHESIIEKEQFNEVQRLMKIKKKTTKVTHENIFKGKIRCNECGKTLALAIRPNMDSHRSFACSTYRRYSKRCTSHYVNYNYLIIVLIDKINELIKLSQRGREKFVSIVKDRKLLDNQLNDLDEVITVGKRRLNEIDTLIKRLFEKYVNDKISEAKFYELDKSYDLEKITLIKEVRSNESMANDLRTIENDINSFYDLIEGSSIIKDLNRELIVSLIDKIVVHEDKNVHKMRIVEVYLTLIGKI
jgi:DNA invertase Pin-like site-specific DNA recombinase